MTRGEYASYFHPDIHSTAGNGGNATLSVNSMNCVADYCVEKYRQVVMIGLTYSKFLVQTAQQPHEIGDAEIHVDVRQENVNRLEVIQMKITHAQAFKLAIVALIILAIVVGISSTFLLAPGVSLGVRTIGFTGLFGSVFSMAFVWSNVISQGKDF